MINSGTVHGPCTLGVVIIGDHFKEEGHEIPNFGSLIATFPQPGAPWGKG